MAELFCDAGAVALITDEAHLPLVEKARADLPDLRVLITAAADGAGIPGSLDYETAVAQASPVSSTARRT